MKQYRINRNKFYIGASDFIDDWNIYYNLMSKSAIELIQYETPMFHFFRYVSSKNIRTSEDDFARQLVLSFKQGTLEDVEWVAQIVALYLRSCKLCGKRYTFVCVPASSEESNEKRYSHFVSEVCRLTRMNNGYGLVNVCSTRKPVHKGGQRDVKNYTIDESVAGRKVVLFDDVYTTGKTWTTFATSLESLGADVVQGLFLAETSA